MILESDNQDNDIREENIIEQKIVEQKEEPKENKEVVDYIELLAKDKEKEKEKNNIIVDNLNKEKKEENLNLNLDNNISNIPNNRKYYYSESIKTWLNFK